MLTDEGTLRLLRNFTLESKEVTDEEQIRIIRSLSRDNTESDVIRRSDDQHMSFVRSVGFDRFFSRQDVKNGIPKKSNLLSTKFREEGNKLYKGTHDEKTHKMMIKFYSKSIAFALNGSEELAFGYSNRSVVLKHLGKCKESLIDIERALQITNSDDLRKKLLTRKGECEVELASKSSSDNPAKELTKEEIDESKVVYDIIQLMLTLSNENLPKLPKFAPIKSIDKKLQLPEIKSSKKIPQLASCVSLRYSEVHGRHMVANRNIKTGEIVAIEEGLVLCPQKLQQYLVCSHCLDFAWNGIPCESCACTIYCTEKCKNEALTLYHDIECLILPFFCCKVYEMTELTGIRLTIRLFIKLIKEEGLDKIFLDMNEKTKKNPCLKNLFSGSYSFYKSIPHHMAITRTEDDDDFFSSMVLELLIKRTTFLSILNDSNEKQQLLKQFFIRLLYIINANMFSFQEFANCGCVSPNCSDICEKKSGSIFAPVSSFFNHSCVNNTSRIFTSGGKIVFFAIMPIKKGEQLCITYGPTMLLSKKERNKRLLRSFKFICNCTACINDLPKIEKESTFQDLLAEKVTDETIDFLNLCSKDVNILSLFSVIKAYKNEKVLQDNIKVVEMAYKNYDPILAHSLTLRSKTDIGSLFDALYGYTCEMSSDCC